MTLLPEQASAVASKRPVAEQDAIALRLRAQLNDRAAQASGWRPGCVESTFGSIADEGFVRHLRGGYEDQIPI